MSNYKHIIWDWNGTLLDDISLCIESMNSILEKRNLRPLDKSRYISVFGFPVKNYYISLGFDFNKEPFEMISDEFMDQYNSRCFTCKLHRGAKEIIEEIHTLGITQSILTAAHQNYIEECVRFYGLEKFFDIIIGLDNTHAYGKTDNGKKLIDALPYEPDEILLIGDTAHDYEVAKEIGCQCILVSWGHHSKERLKRMGAIVISSLDEIPELVK